MAGQEQNGDDNPLSANDEGTEPSNESNQNIVEEYDLLDSQLDNINNALDFLEQKNDDILAKLKELLQSNIDIREQMKEHSPNGDNN